MSYVRHQLGAESQVEAEPMTPAQISAALVKIQKSSEEQLFWRKIATAATIAGALFAMVRLSDIYFAVKARRRAER